jgi:hypothetical protein
MSTYKDLGLKMTKLAGEKNWEVSSRDGALSYYNKDVPMNKGELMAAALRSWKERGLVTFDKVNGWRRV